MDTLKVFISWSGKRSQQIAGHVKELLKDVVRPVEVFISSDDLPKGAQWLTALNKSLDSASYGLAVVTPENQNAPWLLFEAGVISQALTQQQFCPILCSLKPTDVSGPLATFQSTVISDKSDMLKLVTELNTKVGPGSADGRIVERWLTPAWTEFANNVDSALRSQRDTPKERTQQDMLEEILQLVRQIARAEDANLETATQYLSQRFLAENTSKKSLLEALNSISRTTTAAPEKREPMEQIKKLLRQPHEENP